MNDETFDPHIPGPPREVQEDAAAREATPESAGLRAIKVSRQLPYDQLESSFIQKFQVFLEREFLAHAEQARAEEREEIAKMLERPMPFGSSVLDHTMEADHLALAAAIRARTEEESQ